ncbi:MAG: FtsQ-type POTRA domain-containing protein [Peptostreptococcaceae bacterium]
MKKNVSKLTLILSLFSMVLIFLYMIFTSENFNIKHIVFSGNEKIEESEIREILNINENRNIFMYSIKDMKEELSKDPYIESVDIKIKLPNTFNINISKREEKAIITNEKKHFFIDNKGEIIEEVKNLEKYSENMLVIKLEYDIISSKINYSDKDDKENVILLIDSIYNENLHNKIRTIDLNENLAKIITDDYIEVYLKLDNNLRYNISMISSILVDLKSKNKTKGVIDLSNGYALYKER